MSKAMWASVFASRQSLQQSQAGIIHRMKWLGSRCFQWFLTSDYAENSSGNYDHPSPMVSSLNRVRMVRMSETFSIRIEGNMATEQDYWNQMYANACDQGVPSFMYRPKIFIDGNQWCALYGDNLQDGVFGFGTRHTKHLDSLIFNG